MTLRDFVSKKKRELREDGVTHAVKTGVQEAAVKTLLPLADRHATPIWAAEWDVCLVLDACRWDLWCEVLQERDDDPLYRQLLSANESRWSVGSASVEWINETFADEYREHWRDTAYVTGNPHTAKTSDFGRYTDASVYPLQQRGLPYLDEVWADQWHVDEYETVRPDTMTDRAMFAYQTHDRVLVHYMQPHIPFKDYTHWSEGWKNTLAFGENPMHTEKKGDWEKLRDGEIPRDEFWQAYKGNLRWVLEEVRRWCRETDARVLVTSDHGNAMGEWGMWGHPPGSPLQVLREVPWVVIDGWGDGPVEVDPPGDPPATAAEDPNVSERLAALGYLDD